MLNRLPWPRTGIPLIVTLHYAAFFAVGIYLARQQSVIHTIVGSLSSRMRLALASLAATFYVYAGAAWLSVTYRITPDDLAYSASKLAADGLTALGAVGLIVISINSPLCRRILRWHLIHALGKMSYSVYLLHFIVMLLIVHLLYRRMPLLSILLVCFIFTMAASWAFYRLVEIPSMKFGRRFGEFMHIHMKSRKNPEAPILPVPTQHSRVPVG